MTLCSDRMAKPTKDHTVPTNEAQRILLELGVGASELAGVAGVTRQAAHGYLRGKKKPSAEVRSRIEAQWPEAKAKLWDVLPRRPERAAVQAPEEPSKGAVSSVLPESPGGFVDARSAAKAHLEEVEQMLAEAKAEGRMADVTKLLDQRRKSIVDLARFSGELTATEESKLTETQRWREVRQAIVDAVARFPDAAKALAEALEAVDA